MNVIVPVDVSVLDTLQSFKLHKWLQLFFPSELIDFSVFFWFRVRFAHVMKMRAYVNI